MLIFTSCNQVRIYPYLFLEWAVMRRRRSTRGVVSGIGFPLRIVLLRVRWMFSLNACQYGARCKSDSM